MTLDIFRLWHISAALSITFSIRVLQVAPPFHFRGTLMLEVVVCLSLAW